MDSNIEIVDSSPTLLTKYSEVEGETVNIQNTQEVGIIITDDSTPNIVIQEVLQPIQVTPTVTLPPDLSKYYTKDELSNFELELTVRVNSGSYMEFIETDGNVTQVNYWTDNTKTVKLFTKNISYVLGNPTVILVTNELTGMTLTTTIVYSGDDVASITKTLA